MSAAGMHVGGGAQYLNAYLNGMQFVLLALEGKLARMGAPSKDELIEAMYEYHELAMSLRERLRERVASLDPDPPAEWGTDDPLLPL